LNTEHTENTEVHGEEWAFSVVLDSFVCSVFRERGVSLSIAPVSG